MKSSLAVPLGRLADDVQAFVRRPELRALVIVADGHLWSGALRIVLAGEHLADNRSPWLSVEVPRPETIEPWGAVEARLVKEHEALVELRAPLAALEREVAGEPGAGRCAARIRQCVASVREPARGLVIALVADGGVSSPWLARLVDMMLDPKLADVRFVLLAPDEPRTVTAWVSALPPGVALHAVCVMDQEAATAELAAELQADAQRGSEGGGAWPAGVRPPALATTTGSAGVGASAGPAPARAPGSQPPLDTIPTCVKRAVLAMRRGDGPEAVRQQGRARELCVEAGRHEDAVRMELVLGGYLLQLHEGERARAAFGRAAVRAEELGAAGLQAQACYAEAWAWRVERRDESALRCYWAGIEAAKRGGEVTLMFEGYWEAGRVLQPLERPSALVSLWSDAIHSAGQRAPHELRGTRIGEIARELAQVLRGQRRAADARAVDEWAAATTGGAHASS